MRQITHPLVERDVVGIFEHILMSTGGDLAAAERRLDEIDDLLARIASNATSGQRLGGAMSGWLVRHGGRDHKLTIVFRPEVEANVLRVALIAFGGRDWMAVAEGRRD
ncbi:MAG: hypothetical protein DI556_17780 [Rhodovulum sulfidophilum]|uniref:Type II toxin-antitoxin system RelE/ParE family toxin n=1 Tax=Rhodovulum sulfidophilum TaxID=35806 RepID=A0A2W5PY00_RHOSU|nr:MAG: hypothetical protein DI556_17780 [Rhodovulum sulfidophilum]